MNEVSSLSAPVIDMCGVDVWLPNRFTILEHVDWTVRAGEHWALLGPNGSGKTTLLSLAGAVRHPSRGTVSVLGEELGKTSMWDLREQIGSVEPGQKILEWIPIEDVVLTGVTGTVWPMPDRIEPWHRERARDLLDLVGCEGLATRTIGTCSQGERQRVRIARSLMSDPELLLLDEPATGLDLVAREALLAAMQSLARTHPDLATVFVSHHLEELPPTTSHALLLRDGKVTSSGEAVSTITSENISESFGFATNVTLLENRWSARADANWHTRREAAHSQAGDAAK